MLRATSHTSQEPWPCNAEDPLTLIQRPYHGCWDSRLGSHGTSSIAWSGNGPCCGTIAYFVGGKRGEDLISYNMSRTLPIWENYLVVSLFFNPGFYFDICPEIRPDFCAKICHAGEKNSKKNHGHPKFASGPPLGGRPDVNSGRPWNLIHSPPCRTPCRLFIHEVFFGPLGLHLRVWSELGRSPPFRPMRAPKLDCNGHGPSVLCVKWPSLPPSMVTSCSLPYCQLNGWLAGVYIIIIPTAASFPTPLISQSILGCQQVPQHVYSSIKGQYWNKHMKNTLSFIRQLLCMSALLCFSHACWEF